MEQISAWIEALIEAIGYPGIFMATFLENVFPPIPSEPFLSFVGLLISEGRLMYGGVWVSATLGSITGSLIMYSIGRRADNPIIRRSVQRHGHRINTSEKELDRALALFNRYGALVILFGRSVPMLKSIISVAAGVSRMSIFAFVFFTGLHAMLSAVFWLGLGYALAEVGLLSSEIVIPGAIVLVLITAIIFLIRRRFLSRL